MLGHQGGSAGYSRVALFNFGGLLGPPLRLTVYRLFACQQCHALLGICSDCDGSDRYCSEDCSDKARTESMARAGARYQQTERGKTNHAARQRAYTARIRFVALLVLLGAGATEITHQSHASPASQSSVSGTEQPLEERPIRRPLSRPRFTPGHCAFCRKSLPPFARQHAWRWSG
jgi:hypothetical protein